MMPLYKLLVDFAKKKDKSKEEKEKKLTQSKCDIFAN
jgi:hypothetical protein